MVVVVAQPAVVVQSVVVFVLICSHIHMQTTLPLGSTHTAVLRGSQQN